MIKKTVVVVKKEDMPKKRLPPAMAEKLRSSAGVGAHKPKKGSGSYDRKKEKLKIKKEDFE